MEPQSPPQGSGPEQRPTMGPTRAATLIVAGLAAAAVSWLLISRFYSDIPRLPWLPTVTLVGLAVLEGYAALNTRARIDRKPGHEPVEPLTVARFVVLAKASSLVGAIFAGLFAGVLGWFVIERTRHTSQDTPAAVAGLVGSLALVAAALWLERSCRVPEQPDGENEQDSAHGG